MLDVLSAQDTLPAHGPAAETSMQPASRALVQLRRPPRVQTFVTDFSDITILTVPCCTQAGLVSGDHGLFWHHLRQNQAAKTCITLRPEN
jgi:hypothetical protein